MHKIVSNTARLHFFGVENIVPRAVECEYFAKGTEKSKIFDNFLDK